MACSAAVRPAPTLQPTMERAGQIRFDTDQDTGLVLRDRMADCPARRIKGTGPRRNSRPLAAIRQGGEVEKEQVVQEAGRLHDKEVEQEREAEVRCEQGPGHEI